MYDKYNTEVEIQCLFCVIKISLVYALKVFEGEPSYRDHDFVPA